MSRQTIPRNEENGKYKSTDELRTLMAEIDLFSAEVATELLKRFPTIDYYDLENIFKCNFGYRYSRATAMDSAGLLEKGHYYVSNISGCVLWENSEK